MPHDLWLTSSALYRQAAEKLIRHETPEQPGCAGLGETITLHLVDAIELLPGPRGEQGEGGRAFLDDRYDSLLAAAGQGWRTMWFNPQGRIAPATDPIQDADVLDLKDLPESMLALENKPTLAACLDWWEAWAVPDNIRAHAYTVSRSAYHLAVLLRNKGVLVDPILTQRGGLLHDIDKIKTLTQAGAHGWVGAAFLEEQGYTDLAEIVREHIMSTILQPHADERAWEVKLVYFTDKLVEGDQLVPFDKRLDALTVRYPHYRESMEKAAGPVKALSDQICALLSIPSHKNLISTLIELQNN